MAKLGEPLVSVPVQIESFLERGGESGGRVVPVGHEKQLELLARVHPVGDPDIGHDRRLLCVSAPVARVIDNTFKKITEVTHIVLLSGAPQL